MLSRAPGWENGIKRGSGSSFPSESHDGLDTPDAFKALSSEQHIVRAHLGVEVAPAL